MKKILNLGSGSGQNIPQLLGKGEITCVDIYKEGMNICQEKYPNLNYKLISCEDMKFEKKTFNEIYAFDVLEHVTDIDKTMKNIFDILKDDGFLYVEVPYDLSEYMLLRINPNYHKQIGHNRIFKYELLQETFKKYGFIIKNIRRERGIVNLYLRMIFKLGINITDEMCNISSKWRIVERIIMGFCIWFDKNIFNTKLKYIPLRLVTLPIGWIINQIYPKTISFKAYKI